MQEFKDVDCDSHFIHEVSERFCLLCLASKMESPLIFKHLGTVEPKSDTGSTVLHDGSRLMFVFVGAVLH